jgi:lipoyl-dependent peroxiredoxin
MADLERSAQAVWHGDLRGGKGEMSTNSGVLKNTPYSFGTRFEQAPGTNPEELLAAAHAACFSMALSNALSKEGHKVDNVETRAVCHLTPQQPAGFKITRMELVTRGTVDGIDEETFKRMATETGKNGCPVSLALGAIEITVDATLVSTAKAK